MTDQLGDKCSYYCYYWCMVQFSRYMMKIIILSKQHCDNNKLHNVTVTNCIILPYIHIQDNTVRYLHYSGGQDVEHNLC